MDASDVINIGALGIALIAILSSSLLTWRALRLNENANHLPIVLDALRPQRQADFTEKEFILWEQLIPSNHAHDLGFTGLPEPIRGYAYEVGCYYQHLSYMAEYGVADWEFIAVQTEWRLVRTWECIENYVNAERTFRGKSNTFLNSYERFVQRIEGADLDAATKRLYGRGLTSNSKSWTHGRGRGAGKD